MTKVALKYIFWEITHRCNQKCRICPLYGMNSCSPLLKELSTSENKIIMDKINKTFPIKKPRLKRSGGEPFVRRDLIELMSYIEQSKIEYGLMSNFSMLSQSKLDDFLMLHPKFLNISIDGNCDIHNKLRGTNGCYESTISNIKYYVQRIKSDVSIELNCVIQPENLELFSEIIDLATSFNVNVTFQHLNFLSEDECNKQLVFDKIHFNSNVRHYINKMNFFNDKAMIEKLYIKLQNALEYGRKKNANVKIKPNITDLNSLMSYYTGSCALERKCSELESMLFIQPDGTVNACFECYSVGNILKEDFSDILQSEKYEKTIYKLKNIEENPICFRCCKGIFT